MNDPTDTQARLGFDVGTSAVNLFFDNILLSSGRTPSGVIHTNIAVPPTSSLQQNYPNPFNPTTTILFSLAHPEQVTLKVYSLLGEQVANLVDEVLPAGIHKAVWNAANRSNGIYYFVLEVGGHREVRKAVLMK